MSREPWRIAIRLLLFPLSFVLGLVAAIGEYADAAWHWLDHKVP
jgi:hypothetical protein